MPTHSLRHIRTALGFLIATIVLLVLTGCGGPVPPTSITHQAVAIIDISGSTSTLIDGWAVRVQRWANGLPDGTRVQIQIADGASASSICIPRRVDLQGHGNDQTQINDSLTAQRNDVAAVIADQITCGKNNATGGSDLIGSLLTADAALKPGMDTTQIVLFSDGLQYSEDLMLKPETLGNRKAVKKAVETLDDEDLVPSRFIGAEFFISDPAVGGQLTARQAQGLTQFWTAYAKKARASFSVGLP
jgi:hypothetical protein